MNYKVLKPNTDTDEYFDTAQAWDYKINVDALGHLIVLKSYPATPVMDEKRIVAAVYAPGNWVNILDANVD
jgi:hypothetical protein